MSAGSHPLAASLPEPVQLARTRIAGVVYDRAEEIAAQGSTAILAQVPGYGGRDSEFRTDVHDQVARLCRTGLGALLNHRRVTAADLAHTRRAAVRRARSGLPLADYITAFRLGQQTFWKNLIAHAGDSPTAREATLSLVLPLTRYCDLISTEATQAYLDFQQHQSAEAGRDVPVLVEALLAGARPERGPLPAAAAAHGIGPAPGERLVVVAATVLDRSERSAHPEIDAPHIVSSALARTGVNGHRTLAVVRDTDIVAVAGLGRATAGELCSRLRRTRDTLLAEGITTAFGISTVVTGVEQLPAAGRRRSRHWTCCPTAAASWRCPTSPRSGISSSVRTRPHAASSTRESLAPSPTTRPRAGYSPIPSGPSSLPIRICARRRTPCASTTTPPNTGYAESSN